MSKHISIGCGLSFGFVFAPWPAIIKGKNGTFQEARKNEVNTLFCQLTHKKRPINAEFELLPIDRNFQSHYDFYHLSPAIYCKKIQVNRKSLRISTKRVLKRVRKLDTAWGLSFRLWGNIFWYFRIKSTRNWCFECIHVFDLKWFNISWTVAIGAAMAVEFSLTLTWFLALGRISTISLIFDNMHIGPISYMALGN